MSDYSINRRDNQWNSPCECVSNFPRRPGAEEERVEFNPHVNQGEMSKDTNHIGTTMIRWEEMLDLNTKPETGCSDPNFSDLRLTSRPAPAAKCE